jgi:ethanolaminephosphotransferase
MEVGPFSLLVMTFLLVTTQIPVSIYRAMKACEERKKSKLVGLFNILPFLFMLFCATVWIYAPGSTVAPNNTILFIVAWGIANGKINALLVLGHVTHTKYPTYYRLIFPFLTGAVLSYSPILFNM